MKLHHIRNATALLELGDHRLLIDPMLSDPGVLPGFKMFGGERRRNPLVPLPAETMDALEEATGVLLTHEHPDHLDPPAIAWIKRRGLPVWTHPIDLPNLARKGLDARPLEDGALGLEVELVPARHGHGLIGWLMGPVCGYYLAHPDEPSLYLTSDAVLSDAVLELVDRLQPELILAPAGAANFGAGGDILFSLDELVTLAKRASGQLVFNHLEAIDHCPTTRAQLRRVMDAAGVGDRVYIPADGEVLEFTGASDTRSPVGAQAELRPGFQKWLTAKSAGT